MTDLSGRHILVTRPDPQGSELCQLIEAQKGCAIHFPAIAFAPPSDMNAFEQAIAQLGGQDWLIFISPQAVYASVPAIRRQWPHFPPTVQFAAVGAGTAKALHEAGYVVALYPENEWSSEGLLDLPPFHSVTAKKMAIIRGQGGREVIDKILAERGAHVLPVIAYQRILPHVAIEPAQRWLEAHQIDSIVCTSFEAVQNLKTLLGQSEWSTLNDIPLYVMSERIKGLARDLGFRTIWVTPRASNESILETLMGHNNMTDEMVTEEMQPQSEHPPRRRSKGVFFSILVIILFICAFGYGYYQLARVNISLAQTVSDLQKRSSSQQTTLLALQKSVDALQEADQKSQSLAAQQEQVMTEWRAAQKGDLSKWHVAEAQYLVRLANDDLQFEHNSALALILLKRADQIMQSLQDPALLEIQKSIAADIANVQAMPEMNITALYLQLSGLDKQVDQLSLPMNPLKANSPDQTASTTAQPGLSWWKTSLDRSWQALSKIVIVRYNGTNALPLVLPEEKIFLYQNLHAQMEGAMWGVLHRNAEVYQASLARAIAWIQQYFVQDAPSTKSILENLQTLRATNIQPSTTNLSATLQLFDGYFAQAGQAQ